LPYSPSPDVERGPETRRLFEFQDRVIGKTGTAVTLKPNTYPLFRSFILGSQVRENLRKRLLQCGFRETAISPAGSGFCSCNFHGYQQYLTLVKAVEARRQVMATGTRDSTLLEVEKSKVKPPPLFKVLLLNDDYTPMDFVVSVLQTFFSMTREQATQIMLKVHKEGMGVCGVYPKDVAATKVEQVIAFSRQHQHPLQCVMEET
jgi:ATP-dependent Clp protease adaptor protein ClpS